MNVNKEQTDRQTCTRDIERYRTLLAVCVCVCVCVVFRLAGFDGELLLEYKRYRHSSSHNLTACVHDERQNAGLSLADVMRLNKALRQL